MEWEQGLAAAIAFAFPNNFQDAFDATVLSFSSNFPDALDDMFLIVSIK